ncbi:MAG: hypothetical protein ABT22_11245 [Thiobacillus sp. SCN 64-317]|nr:MAG: hypothetical protein ABT22_11245 [Thiobacillus sp. SCN 64-317]
MQADDGGGLPFVEMAMYGVSDLDVEAGQIVGLGDNVRPNPASDEAAFRCFFYDEMNFGHDGSLEAIDGFKYRLAWRQGETAMFYL